MRWRIAALSVIAACSFGGRSTADGPRAGDASAADGAVDADPLLDGLIAWYRMDAFAGVAEDATGNGHTGTCTSCPEVVAGAVGNGYQYDGTTQRIDVAETPALVTAAGFTVAFWVNFDTLPGGYACVVNKGQTGGIYDTWQLCHEGSTQRWFFGTTAASFDALTSGPGPTPDTWYHVAIWWDGATKQLWVDGAMLASRSQTGIVFDGMPVTIGADIDNTNNTHAIDAILDDVRIYGRALAVGEIARLATP